MVGNEEDVHGPRLQARVYCSLGDPSVRRAEMTEPVVTRLLVEVAPGTTLSVSSHSYKMAFELGTPVNTALLLYILYSIQRILFPSNSDAGETNWKRRHSLERGHEARSDGVPQNLPCNNEHPQLVVSRHHAQH